MDSAKGFEEQVDPPVDRSAPAGASTVAGPAVSVGREIEDRLRSLAREAGQIIWTATDEGLAGDMSNWRLVTGQSEAEAKGLGWLDAVHPDDRAQTRRMWLGAVASSKLDEMDFRVRRRDGMYRSFLVRAVPILRIDGRVREWVGTCTDITERRQQESGEPYFLHDPLTDLPNRALFEDRLEQAILAAQRTGTCLAVLALDLDRFREVGYTLGSDEADAVLREVGERLRGALRASDTVARLRDDEFAVLSVEVDELGATLVARKLFATLDRPIALAGEQWVLPASVGISLYPQHGKDAKALIQHAEAALYTAQRSAGGYAVYAAGQESTQHMATSLELRAAIQEERLQLRYQPRIDLRSGLTTSLEALVQWDHPQHGMVPADQLVSVAELSGQINALTCWVLDAALAQCRAWNRAGLDVGVAVNLSPQSLYSPHLVDDVQRLLQKHEVAPAHLSIEITESPIMAYPERMAAVLTRLHNLGVRLCIDDFGTGYSSLAYLRRLPVDEIKIDRSFVADMVANEDDSLLVQTLVDAGHRLGVTVAAEGVESRESWAMLAEFECDVVQGYALSEPLPAEEVPRWALSAPLKAP